MELRDLSIEHSYISYGDNNIVKSLIGPALRVSSMYKRSVAFFSSSVFSLLANDIVAFVGNGGHIQLICGLQLSQEDKDAISMGYMHRDALIGNIFSDAFIKELDELGDNNIQLLEELIAKGHLDIQLAIPKGTGIYHDKLGIIQDKYGNSVVFYGSPNASAPAYSENYEKIRTAVSWKEGYSAIVQDELKEFERLWNKNNPYVDVYNYTEKAHEIVIRKKSSRKQKSRSQKGVTLRDYQKRAIQAWIDNKFHGFYVMATGTGKTWTAIYSAKALLKLRKAIIVICAPYKHLIKQWREDLVKVFPGANIIMVSSENPGWDVQIVNSIIANKYHPDKQIIIISTIKSFSTERFDNAIQKSKQEKLLIVDEAHRFKCLDKKLREERYNYLLGLSATPGNGKNVEFTEKLLDFFGGEVFTLPIEEAMKRKYLVQYNYFPIFVHATEDEENRFDEISRKMAACFRNGVCIDPESLAKLSRGRLRIISMAEEKLDNIEDILDQVKEKDHFVIYCGDGRLFNNNNEEVRHIRYVKSVLDSHGKKACQFTATENMDKRMDLVDGFNKGEFDSLVAIRCLDEGINIPSIKGALILSSNDDYREFVQRRGRILRLYEGKQQANIYDVIVLPSTSSTSWATIELRRFYEYARLSINRKENLNVLNMLLGDYGIEMENIKVFTDTEDEIDE